MAKSGKRKSGKKQGTGQTLGALALIIAIGALGLGLYQFILPAASEGPKIYVSENKDFVLLDSPSKYIPQLNVTYNAKAGDSVLFEYSCQAYLEPTVGISLAVYFDINGTIPSPYLSLHAVSVVVTSGYMRYNIESSTAGEYQIRIFMTIDDATTNSYVRFNLLTVTVY